MEYSDCTYVVSSSSSSPLCFLTASESLNASLLVFCGRVVRTGAEGGGPVWVWRTTENNQSGTEDRRAFSQLHPNTPLCELCDAFRSHRRENAKKVLLLLTLICHR